jgi:hypothetical protein
MSNICFEENQRFREIAIFVILWVLQLIFLAILAVQLFSRKLPGVNPTSDTILILINLVLLILNLLLYSLKLKTVNNEKFISIKMSPYHIRERIFKWSEIKDMKVVKYDGVMDYLGYGLRYMPGKGWCYTILGEYGIRLTFTNGKKILIGTHKPKEVSQIIDDLIIKGILAEI